MKKVLIISYYWPPAGGVGVLRSLKIAKYLRRFGWEPVVFAPLNADYPHLDERNSKDIPENLEVIRFPVWEPFKLFKIFTGRGKEDSSNPVYAREKKVKLVDDLAIWIRGNFFIPDARFMWIRPSVKFLKKYLKKNQVDAIFTDGPPHTNTVIGLRLSEDLAIPWLADFQDPWTQVDYYEMFKISRWADKKHKKLEQHVFNAARKITIASPSWAKDLESIGARSVEVLYYGYDEDDFRNLKQTIDSDFTIVHAGLLGYDRNPDILFQVLKDLKNELPGFSEKLKLNFAGNIDYIVRKHIADNNLTENLNDLGFIKREKALELTLNGQLLLLPLNKAKNVKGRIPGKLYENLRAKRPILCLGPQDSDVATILRETGAGKSIDYEDYAELKDFIAGRYELFLKNQNEVSTKNYERFSNENQTEFLSRLLNQMVS